MKKCDTNFNFNLNVKVNLEDLLVAVKNCFIRDDNEEENEEMASFALSLGENGDLTYELILLKKVTELICSVYDDVTADDPDMYNLIQKIKELTPLINNI